MGGLERHAVGQSQLDGRHGVKKCPIVAPFYLSQTRRIWQLIAVSAAFLHRVLPVVQ